MARKHRLGPDTRDLKRFNWRNPHMPVLMDYAIENELGVVVERGTDAVGSQQAQEIARANLAAQEYDHHYPNWRNDPTYSRITGQKKAPSPRPIAMKKSLIKW